jgi:hypothetical protein
MTLKKKHAIPTNVMNEQWNIVDNNGIENMSPVRYHLFVNLWKFS